ncbi:hypothetical protein F4801DRAFT_379121 [Xylaria longipes]|nr:hypothetical protein F4801DRAFT_379121 [Xylaria longipes]
MKFSILATATVLGAVSALPGTRPMITAAPELKDVFANASANHTSTACTSTDCWASYAECYGTLTFVYLCYTPPPCGTVTSPDPYSCPPPTSSPKTSATPTTFAMIPASRVSTAPTAPNAAVAFETSAISS